MGGGWVGQPSYKQSIPSSAEPLSEHQPLSTSKSFLFKPQFDFLLLLAKCIPALLRKKALKNDEDQ